MSHTHEQLIEIASQYAAGVLPPDEMEAFEHKLIAGDKAYLQAYQELQGAGEALIGQGEQIEPDMIIRSNLINMLGIEKPNPDFSEAGTAQETPFDAFAQDPKAMVFLNADRIDWLDSGIEGVQIKNLFIDKEANRVTLLLKVAPGTVYPDHDHFGIEELMMLEGDLTIAGKKMKKFDYMRIPDGGQHSPPWTKGGCICMVIASLNEAA